MKIPPAIPHQSRRAGVLHPGITRAAIELGVHRGHLHRVLTGERKSKTLLTRWHAWLKLNPEISRIASSIKISIKTTKP